MQKNVGEKSSREMRKGIRAFTGMEKKFNPLFLCAIAMDCATGKP